MPSAVAGSRVPQHLEQAAAVLDAGMMPNARRSSLLARSFEMRSGRERAGRFWKIDIDALNYDGIAVRPYIAPSISAPAHERVVACDLRLAHQVHGDILRRAMQSAVDPESQKFTALSAALRNSGAFIYVPADVCVDDPIEITYDTGAGALFPYTLVVLEDGAQCTVIERVIGADASLVCGISEIFTGGNAHVIYAVEQDLGDQARVFSTRAAKPGHNSRVDWAIAELGSALSVGSVDIRIEHPGVHGAIAALFFANGQQHVDYISNVDHHEGNSRSETIVKSAATERGQGRYVGNIRIAPHAQGTDSALRDDALLLSAKAHIDSVPALEIAANDVKAYHGATVGAIDEEQLFYMTSRGIDRASAEKMIALGFFEPAIERFPTHALRERVREALARKVGQ